jgi:hypothetical protein
MSLPTLAEKIDRINEAALTIRGQRDDARAALLDIIRGCDGMLQPALNVKGALRSFIEEVKRVAQDGIVS